MFEVLYGDAEPGKRCVITAEVTWAFEIKPLAFAEPVDFPAFDMSVVAQIVFGYGTSTVTASRSCCDGVFRVFFEVQFLLLSKNSD